MLTLDLPTGPRWIDLPEGVRVRVRPVTTAVMQAAQHYAARQINAAREAGTLEDDWAQGLTWAELVVGLARHSIVEWEGVADAAGEPLPVTPEYITMLVQDHWHIANEFWRQATEPARAVSAEGNGSAPVPHGSGAAAQPTAGVANALG